MKQPRKIKGEQARKKWLCQKLRLKAVWQKRPRVKAR